MQGHRRLALSAARRGRRRDRQQQCRLRLRARRRPPTLAPLACHLDRRPRPSLPLTHTRQSPVPAVSLVPSPPPCTPFPPPLLQSPVSHFRPRATIFMVGVDGATIATELSRASTVSFRNLTRSWRPLRHPLELCQSYPGRMALATVPRGGGISGGFSVPRAKPRAGSVSASVAAAHRVAPSYTDYNPQRATAVWPPPLY